jgi:hypothetical protein
MTRRAKELEGPPDPAAASRRRANLQRDQMSCPSDADRQIRQQLNPLGSATTSRSIPEDANSKSITGAWDVVERVNQLL